ncbi:RidA family protein [Brevibacillus ginsengisoli]|uniref:RidA family protein n=1 Tax=Brevibacillus ginsengisoli TaxID=363854 RepID=UPI003CF2F95B
MSTSREKNNLIPQGKYVPASRVGNMIYTAGMTPRTNGVLIQSGKVSAEKPVDTYKQASIQAVTNALTAARNLLTEHEKLEQIVSLTVYINAEETFEAHSSLADFASEYLYEELGSAGVGSRAAIGVASLPGNSSVEIQLIASVSFKGTDYEVLGFSNSRS